ncbi:hypothetical protein ALC60_12003 [Trachymyrmex zeteki]|uniref:Uncharacterized protein n=1 Tax=Mycetomoellerius zeteki TaxID=64791 RepID=A0A151WMA2_9HYME|nr:hypothetical protein ALC60_12003 [Trachymyrmex zeteki]
MYTKRGLAKPRRKKRPTGRISRTPFVSAMTIGKRVVTLRLRRECCWIYSIRELQFGDIFLITTVRNKPSIPVSSRVTSIIRLECRRNKWSNHPPTLTIWRKQSSTAIHPYIVARTKSLATADLRYALYINQPPPVPPLRTTIRTQKSLLISRTHDRSAVANTHARTHAQRVHHAGSRVHARTHAYLGERVVERSYEAVGKTVTWGYASFESRRTAAASQVIDPLSVRSREFGVPASWSTRRSIDPANPATRSTCAFARTKPTSYDHLPVHKSPKTRRHHRAFRQLRAGAPDAPVNLILSLIYIYIFFFYKDHNVDKIWEKNSPNKCKHERVKGMTAAAMKMAGRPTLVEYKAAGGLGSESRGQSEPVGRARRQPQPQTERLRAASAPEHRPH